MKCYEVDSTGRPIYSNLKPVIISSIAGKIFLNFYNPGDDMSEEGYYLFEFRKVSNTEFVLAGIKEHKIDYEATPAEIKRFLEKNKNDKDLFDPAETSTYKKALPRD